MALSQFFEQKEEKEIYKIWEEHNVNQLKTNHPEKPPFVLTMPPPNANGELHLGHVFGYVTMDILGRFYRAQGTPVLLLPGKDHAGIQTQVVFEKKLASEKVDISSLSRDDLYKKAYAFCMDRSQYMREQEKSIGISADWGKEFFTLDPKLNEIVFETFVKMYNDGLVYKGPRIVNWSVFSQTAISDVEVEYQEQKGHLWHILYSWEKGPTNTIVTTTNANANFVESIGDAKIVLTPQPLSVSETIEAHDKTYIVYKTFKDAQSLEHFAKEKEITLKIPSTEGHLSIVLECFNNQNGLITATTRPETLLGDTALAYHPEDPRYKGLAGCSVRVPMIGRTIKVITSTRLDPLFGTGILKVTPAHDFNDYEIGVESNLDVISVIGKDGKMTAEAGAYAGLSVIECREKLIDDLKNNDLLISTKEMIHKVPISERGKDIIEPLISEQWWIAVDKPGNSLKEKALKLLKAGKIKIYPENFLSQVIAWFEGLNDWNISRQLWWGHQMPVWYRGEETYVGTTPPHGDGWIQETDTFDTWFSSGQWPYSTTAASGLHNLNENESAFFPTHTMVMGRDILFFWACRMILFAAYRLDTVPFRNLYFHGLIRDEKGQKMSKSKGNGVEPKEMLEKFGADAVRLGMIIGTSPGIDLKFSAKKIEGYSKFTNKLWNAGKLLDLKRSELKSAPSPTLTLQTHAWVFSKQKEVFKDVTEKLQKYEIPQAADALYDFAWFTYCDWYLEALKALTKLSKENPSLTGEVLFTLEESFKNLLLMLHPFIPFVTEKIYMELFPDEGLLAQRKWSLSLPKNEISTQEFGFCFNLISAVRQVKASVGIPQSIIQCSLSTSLSSEGKALIEEMARIKLVPQCDGIIKPFNGGSITCEVPDKGAYTEKLQKEFESVKKRLESTHAKLSGDFAQRADPGLIAEEKKKQAELQAMFDLLKSELSM